MRKQTAVKASTKTLAKLRRLVQAYALARPAIRFRLRILKSSHQKGDLNYAPLSTGNLEDAVLKVMGKDCALQCEWTAIDTGAFEIHAFLPKPTAVVAKIANYGAFISVDARPVSCSRGTMKLIVAAFKKRTQAIKSQISNTNQPFFLMNIKCPPGGYDANIEPAKDDVLFADSDVVLRAVEDLLAGFYPETLNLIDSTESNEDDSQFQNPREADVSIAREELFTHVEQQYCPPHGGTSAQESLSGIPRWRHTMYGVDEEDLGLFQDNQAPFVDEDEEVRALEVSNPWTIARMNAATGQKSSFSNGQLPSPTKSQKHTSPSSSSPARMATPRPTSRDRPSTPQSSNQEAAHPQPHIETVRSSIQDLVRSGMVRQKDGVTGESVSHVPDHVSCLSSTAHIGLSVNSNPVSLDISRSQKSRTRQWQTQTQSQSPYSPELQPAQRKRFADNDKARSFESSEGSSDSWFGQPMRGSNLVPQTRHSKRTAEICNPPVSIDKPRLSQVTSYPTNNADIRNYLGASDPLPMGLCTNTSSPHNNRNRHEQHFKQQSGNGIQRPQMHLVSSAGSQASMPSEITQSPPNSRGHLMRNLESVHNLPEIDRSIELIPFRPASDAQVPVQAREEIVNSDTRSRVSPCISQKTHDMNAYFDAVEDREVASSTRRSNAITRCDTRATQATVGSPSSSKTTHISTNRSMRTRSANLTLERTPAGFHVHNIVKSLPTDTSSISITCKKLDMRMNSQEWGYSCEIKSTMATEPILISTLMDWVITLNNLLSERYERLEDVDTLCELHESIQRALDANKEEGTCPSITGIGIDNIGSELNAVIAEDRAHVDPGIVREQTPAIDLIQGTHADKEDDIGRTVFTEQVFDKAATQTKEDFDEDIDDDMLMEL